MRKRPVAGFWLAAVMLLAVFCPGGAMAEDAMELLRERDGARTNNVSLNYRQVPLERVILDLARQQPGINLQIKAETFQEEQELLATPVTMGPLSGVSWDTALRYVADRMGLLINRTQVSDGIIFLEKVARFTDTLDGMRLGEVIREIAKRGNANVIFSPLVGTDAPVFLSFTDVPWREALESVLKAHSCTVLYDADGRIMRIATAAEADIQFETRTRPLRYVQPEGAHFQPEIVKDDHQSFVGRKSGTSADVGKSLINVLEQIRSDRGAITYESRTNTLILRDTPIKIQEMLMIVDEIDIAPQQVLIETRLVTLEENPSLNLGVRWGGQDSSGNYTGIDIGADNGPSWNAAWPFAATNNWGNLGGILRPAHPAGQYPTQGGGSGSGGSYTLGTMNLSNLTFMLQAAQYDDSIKITQAPQILVLDHEEASVFIGSVRNYALVESTQSETTTSYSVTEKEILVGVQLLVVPHVIRGTDQVILEIIPKQSDQPVISTVRAGYGVEVDIPTHRNVKTVHTKMMLHSSETGVIAGLFREEHTNQERKVPGLSRIPVVGALFRHSSKISLKYNSMILVTPTIVPPKHGEEFDRDVEALKNSLASSLK
ncbi:MAG: hypothetical protein FWG74_03005 [Planctomycetes bacterium]|nr:hypothetical protein [Planctomycetota bacterium]